MKKSNHYLPLDALSLLADFLEDGYSLKDCLTLLEVYEDMQGFHQIKQKMSQGMTFEEAILHFQIDKDWLEYFCFMSHFSSLQTAIRGALLIVQTKKRFKSIFVKQLSYPVFLIFTMMAFTILFGGMIIPQIEQLSNAFTIESGQNLFLEIMMRLPFVIFGTLISVIIIFIKVLFEIQHRNYLHLFKLLKIPLVSTCIKYYYSLKFASYYGALSVYVSGLKDSVTLMYEQLADSDLMVVIDLLKSDLENGISFDQSIKSNPFLHPGFIRCLQLSIKLGNVQYGLEDYVDKTIQILEKKVKKLSQIIVYGIYVLTAIFIITLYLGMMMPMMNIASQL